MVWLNDSLTDWSWNDSLTKEAADWLWDGPHGKKTGAAQNSTTEFHYSTRLTIQIECRWIVRRGVCSSSWLFAVVFVRYPVHRRGCSTSWLFAVVFVRRRVCSSSCLFVDVLPVMVMSVTNNLGEIKNGGFSRKAFERAILFGMGFSCFSHGSVSNLLFMGERIIQTDCRSEF